MRLRAIPLIALLVVGSFILVSCGGSIPGTIRKFYSGMENMDGNKIKSTIHPDSPMYPSDSDLDTSDVMGDMDFGDMFEMSVGAVNVTSQSGDTATATAEVTMKITFMGESVEETMTQTFEMRKRGGGWLIWDYDFGSMF